MESSTPRKRALRVVLVFAVVCFLVGLGGLFALPQFFARNTYVSENALQHGLHEVSLGNAVSKADRRNAAGSTKTSFFSSF